MGTTEDAPAFRGDVQGMRAVAVLAVICAHAAVPGFGGGFVGVDVFFVISGFLITQLILTGIVADGTLRGRQFYARRARRIVPAASVVLAITIVASVVYLNFLDAIDATGTPSGRPSSAPTSASPTQGVDYFALEESPSPMQHYWSLAVEEQFYLAWPLLVGLAVIVDPSGRAAGRAAGRRTLAGSSLSLGGASLAWSVHRTVDEPTSAYFSTFTRAWELAAGALVALVLRRRHARPSALDRRAARPGRSRWRSCSPSWPTTTTMAFPGYAALLPVCGPSPLLLAGADPRRPPWLARGAGSQAVPHGRRLVVLALPVALAAVPDHPAGAPGRDLTVHRDPDRGRRHVPAGLPHLPLRRAAVPHRRPSGARRGGVCCSTRSRWRSCCRPCSGPHAPRPLDLSAEHGNNPPITPSAVGIPPAIAGGEPGAGLGARGQGTACPSPAT